MASDRVIIVRIRGIGFDADKAYPLTLTSRPLSYLQSTAIEGVVTNLTTQLSSEIGIFSSMGSDPTTTFSVLANTQTLSVLMSRGASEVRGINEASIQTTRYVTPSPAPTIHVTDASTIGAGDIVRINGAAYYVTGSDSSTPGQITAQMAYGSVPQPIPLHVVGNQATGSTLYASYWQGNHFPTGGAEQQAVTISTVEIDAPDATHETVIFRGVVSRISLQTSAGTDNQLSVECMSLMGVIKNAPWSVAQSGLRYVGYPGFSERRYNEERDAPIPPNNDFEGVLKTYVSQNITGPIFEFSAQAYDTRYATLNVRNGGYGGVTAIVEATANELTLAANPVTTHLNDFRAVGFSLIFNDGYYRTFSVSNGDDLTLTFAAGSDTALARLRARYSTDIANLSIDESVVAEMAFSAKDFQSAIVDLIFGTYNTDPEGGEGVRAWGMAAWIPFSFSEIADIIDLGSLNNAFNTDQMQVDLPLMQMWNPLIGARVPNTVIVPVKPSGPKTIGEVLDNMMKNLGLFMVYDKGRISFGRWASENPWATAINDSDFAEPKVGLTFDRSNSIQSVTVEYPAVITAEKLSLTKNPVANIERIISGAGKVVSVGSFMQQGDDYQAATINSFAFSNGTNLITRYSQAACIIEVTLRDATKMLSIGEYVAFSSEFIVNGRGSMGVVNATGIVLKAARSWQTPTTSYTLFLPGYLFAENRVSMVSVSGRVLGVADSGVIVIEDNAFTSPLSQIGAPKTDQEAFDQTLQRTTGSPKNFICALYDQYGTPYNITASLIGVGGVALVFLGSEFDTAIPGDIIMMNFATDAFRQMPEDLQECWDAFQADNSGMVNGDAAFSYPWSR